MSTDSPAPSPEPGPAARPTDPTDAGTPLYGSTDTSVPPTAGRAETTAETPAAETPRAPAAPTAPVTPAPSSDALAPVPVVRFRGPRLPTLALGIVGLVVGGVTITQAVSDVRIDLGSVWLVALVGLGLALVVGSIVRPRSHQD